jgi:outer membrane protein TolC
MKCSLRWDVVRDQAVVDLNINNEQVLRRQLDASRDRFNVGEITGVTHDQTSG